MKRQLIIAILTVLLLVFGAGCNAAQQADNDTQEQNDYYEAAPVSLQLKLEEYPVMDGSTANLPMMAEVMSQVCGISLEEAEELTTCAKTPRAWENLVNGTSDILLVYEAAEDTKKVLDESGVELEITPVGRDALVFINNEKNPVDTLTQKGSVVKNPTAFPGDLGDPGSILGLGRSPGEGKGNTFQYSCLENSMERGGLWVTVHRFSKSQTQLKQVSMHAPRILHHCLFINNPKCTPSFYL